MLITTAAPVPLSIWLRLLLHLQAKPVCGPFTVELFTVGLVSSHRRASSSPGVMRRRMTAPGSSVVVRTLTRDRGNPISSVHRHMDAWTQESMIPRSQGLTRAWELGRMGP
jgi:hypothetical protein